MRIRALATLALAACATDTGFQQGVGDQGEGSNGVISVTPSYLNFGEVDLLYAKSITMGVGSSGEEDLLIYGARIVANPSAAFTFEEKGDVVLPPGEVAEWPVAAYITAEGQYIGSIRIESNDATTPTLFIDLCVTSTGYAEACPEEAPSDDTGDTGDSDTGDSDTGDSDTGDSDTGDSGA
jgi:hypothetical protein